MVYVLNTDNLSQAEVQRLQAQWKPVFNPQSQEPEPRSDVPVRGRGQVTYRAPPGPAAGSDGRDTRGNQSSSLKKRKTRDDEDTQGPGSQVPLERSPALANVPLIKQSDEARRAARAIRFAPGSTATARSFNNVPSKVPDKHTTSDLGKDHDKSPLVNTATARSNVPEKVPEKHTPSSNLGKRSRVPVTPAKIFKVKPDPIVEPNYEYKAPFFDYGNDSLPILYSIWINHVDGKQPITEPSFALRQDALALYRRSWSGDDLGRTDTPKTGPTRTIDDVDLYFRHGKIHVAAERGLLLAADYLRMIGVPDTQPVRFDGKKPAWAKEAAARAAVGKRDYRGADKGLIDWATFSYAGLLAKQGGK
ncbi:hypothetical protein N0V83_010765 [Neocucurbitaria cava]|uniref:Uncharacterized protein n=1 Tax=Neocucurbitaria cava TaxID=798079 RepID=A0A9W8Y002_9PLEO|nr:hypothetical protein N0V83_010765 [Neocucurbitaria cava]